MAEITDKDEGFKAIHPDSLYEQVFVWTTEEDIWGGISDSDLARRLKAELIQAFTPFSPPDQRRMSQFGETLIRIETLVAGQGTNWSECQSTSDRGDDLTLRTNTVLALYKHLRWIYEVYRHVPGACVTIR